MHLGPLDPIANKTLKFYKSRMADSSHLKIKKIAIFQKPFD